MKFQPKTLPTAEKEEQNMQSLTKQTAKIFWKHAMRYKGRAIVIALGLITVTVADVVSPILFRTLINIIAKLDVNRKAEALWIVAWMMALGFFAQGVWRTMGFTSGTMYPRVIADLLNTCYKSLQKHSYTFFANNFAGALVTKTLRYARSYESVDSKLKWGFGRTFLLVVVIQVTLFIRLPVFGFILLAWFVFYVVFAFFFARYKLPRDLAVANQDTLITAHLSDTIANSNTVKQFSAQQFEEETFRGLTGTWIKLKRISIFLGQKGEIFQSVAAVLLQGAIYFTAVILAFNGAITVGDVGLLLLYISQLIDNLWELGRQIGETYENFANANEMTEMLQMPNEIVDQPGASELVVSRGAIQFKGVGFQYGTAKPLLDDFNLTIAPGERVALVGPSGAGKSSIIKLLLRFLDIQQGQILIDGQDIAKATQDSVRRAIAMVPQDPSLFHRSLADNIAYGKRDATQAEIEQAAIAAHCHEFISALAGGYETFVGERGVKLSGGERQRVAIARAILANQLILILDEATSSLDSQSEALIQDALETLMAGKTTIVVAHRLSTIQKMDRIVVIADGRIVEEGSHEMLLKLKGGHYRTLWEIQSQGFDAPEDEQNGTVH